MKRTWSLIGLAAVTACLVGGGVGLVFAQAQPPQAPPVSDIVISPPGDIAAPPLPSPAAPALPAPVAPLLPGNDKQKHLPNTFGGVPPMPTPYQPVAPYPVQPPMPQPPAPLPGAPSAHLPNLHGGPGSVQILPNPEITPYQPPTMVQDPPGAVASQENPTGRQEPAVSLEWIGAATARLNQPATYQLIAKNISGSPVHNVLVKHRIPSGVRITNMEPKAVNDGTFLTWDLGMLMPMQEKRIDLQIIPEAKAQISCQATVTFTGSSTMKVMVREPKLVLKASTPDKIVLGDTATVSLTVSNPGDGQADHVKIKALLPEGLEHARGKLIEVDLGNLAPGENRTVQLVCLTKMAGQQLVDCVAVADSGLNAQDVAKVDIVLPRLDLVVSGPRLRYLERHATYTLKITNPGSAPASNVSLMHHLPQGFKFHAASNGGRHDFSTRVVSWYVGDLTPGESREVTLEVVAVNVGEHKHFAVATATRGLKTECEVMTRVEGLSALLMELVDTDDPVEVNADTTYEIRVTNTGSKTETNLELVCTIPDKMEFRGAKSITGCKFRVEGREIIFEALPRLAPRADAIYRVVLKGLVPGDMRFRARIRADGLTEPVLREESTKVYGD